MTGDLRQVLPGALTFGVQLGQNWLTTLQMPAERDLREHAVFHVPNDYVTQQAQYLKVRKRVAD
jgi:hypothetical protein